MVNKSTKILMTISALSALVLLNSCWETTISPPLPTPTPTPTIITPTPTPTPVFQLPQPIIAPFYKIEFGPGTKGPELEFGPGTKGPEAEFGPGTKGPEAEFGPGTKGPEAEFGPGTKGPENLRFNLHFPEGVLRPDLPSFTTQQVLDDKVNQVEIELIYQNQLYSKTTVLPKDSQIVFKTQVHPVTYTVQVKLIRENSQSDIYWTRLDVKQEKGAEIRVELHQNQFKPEDLDIGLLTRNDLPNP